MKALVAKALAGRVVSGETIGIGSGSTVELAVGEIGKRIAEEGITVCGIPTSHRIARIAEEAGITVLPSASSAEMSWAFDGADEVDPTFRMIKGNGAAMLTEKIVAKRANKLIIIVSEDKLVDTLGSKFPVPIEVIPEAIHLVDGALKELGSREWGVRQASSKYGPLITEHNNLVVDAWFDGIDDDLEGRIKSITGVVESGLFFNCNQEVLVAGEKGVRSQSLVDGAVKEEVLSIS